MLFLFSISIILDIVTVYEDQLYYLFFSNNLLENSTMEDFLTNVFTLLFKKMISNFIDGRAWFISIVNLSNLPSVHWKNISSSYLRYNSYF